jgi:hypothetical protein
VKVTLGERFKSMGMFPDVGKLTDMFDQKFRDLVAKLDEIKGVLIEIRDKQAGGAIGGLLAAIGFVVVVMAVAFAVCMNTTGATQSRSMAPAYHERDEGDCDWSGDCGDDSYHNEYGNRGDQNRRRNRGSFSPGPFDRSPVTIIICPPGTQYCGSDGGRPDQPPEERSYV